MELDLKQLRVAKQIPGKDMVAVVQRRYPKFDKTMLSKCENGSVYGVMLRPDASEDLLQAFDAERITAAPPVKKCRHRLTCRISARLEDADYAALQQYSSEDGYATMQDWITDIVRAYIKSKEGSNELPTP